MSFRPVSSSNQIPISFINSKTPISSILPSENHSSLEEYTRLASSALYQANQKLTTEASPLKKRKVVNLDAVSSASAAAYHVPTILQSSQSSSSMVSQTTVQDPSRSSTPPRQLVEKKSYEKIRSTKTPRFQDPSRITAPFVLKALSILDTFRIKGDLPISAMEELFGQHSQIYCVRSTTPVIEGRSNETIYIKIFHYDVLKEFGNLIQKSFVPSMLSQYDALCSAGFRVVNVLNRDTVLEDGYLVVERLEPFSVPWNAATKLEDLSATERQHLDYMLSLFRFGLLSASSIPLDLHRGNFGLDQDGNLVLLDLMERDEDEAYAFRLFARTHALSLSNGSTEIYGLFVAIAKELADSRLSPIAENVYLNMIESEKS